MHFTLEELVEFVK